MLLARFGLTETEKGLEFIFSLGLHSHYSALYDTLLHIITLLLTDKSQHKKISELYELLFDNNDKDSSTPHL